MRKKLDKEYDILVKLQSKCVKEENDTLKYYCDCMLKLWRIFYKISETGMLSYIDRIMSPVFPLMVQFFDDRVNAYYNSTTEKERVDIGEDIERSIVTFWEVQETIIQSSNGADRILFQSAPLDSGLHYVAPKLCAFYSEVLNSLSRLFMKKNEENRYAFCVYPSLSSQAEAERLFTTMKKKGKVGIIRVPGRDIANISYIMVLLFHEFFHTIPGSDLRLRKKRARNFLNILLYDLMAMIERDTEIKSEDKETYRKYLFGVPKEEIQNKIHDTGENDRFFYSNNIMGCCANSINKYLFNESSSVLAEISEKIYLPDNGDSFCEYKQKRDEIKKINNRLNNNIMKICSSLAVQKKCRFIMGVFREAYADLLCVLMLKLTPEQYFDTFRYGQNISDRNHRGIGLYLRAFCVKEVMSAPDAEYSIWRDEIFEPWREWSNKMETSETRNRGKLVDEVFYLTQIYKSGVSFNVDEQEEWENAQIDNSGTEILINKIILERYLEYFKLCCNDFEKHICQKKNEVDSFEDQYRIGELVKGDDVHFDISFRNWE